MSFQNKRSGFIETEDGNLDYYLNDIFIKTIKSEPIEDYEYWGPIFFTGKSLYKTRVTALDSQDVRTVLFKCLKAGDDCKEINVFYERINSGKTITKCDIEGINCTNLNIPDKNFILASFK